MATPTEHRQAAEAILNRPSHLASPDQADYAVAEVHAILATRAGTDDHYTQSEAGLTEFIRKPWAPSLHQAARVHAHLAESA